MLYLRTAIFTLVFIVLGTLTYALWNFGSDFQIDQARDAYLKGDSALARQHLALSQREEDPDLLLYLAYVDRDAGETEEVKELLSQALSVASVNRTPHLVSEILLNQAIEAFSLRDDEELDHILVDVSKITPDNSQLVGFRGLLLYLKGDYAEALQEWSEWKNETTHFSDWFEEGCARALGSHWLELHRARCQLATGQVLVAREGLEELSDQLQDSEMEDALFLLGFSHIQEGAERPAAARLPYFALALSYFDRVPLAHPRFAIERKVIEEQLITTAQTLVEQESVASLSSLVTTIGRWGLDDALQEVGKLLTQRIKQLCDGSRWAVAKEFAQLMIRLEGVCEQHQESVALLRQRIDSALAATEIAKAQATWSVLQSTSSDPAALARVLADETEAKIQEVISDDDEGLTRTTPYILFWEEVQRDHAERLLFAKRLLVLAGALWVDEDESERPFELMKLAGALPYLTEKQEFKRDLERTIGVIYQQILQTEESKSLAQLIEVIRYFHLEGIDFEDATEVANQLEDAEYLYKKGEYQEALRRIQVLLVFESDHQDAHRIAGMIQLELGKPDVALAHLKRVWKLDDEGKTALGVAEVLVGDSEVGLSLLKRVKRAVQSNSRLTARLGYGLFAKGEYAEAMKWLQPAADLEPSVRVGLAAVAFEMEKWDQVLEHLEHVAPPYNQLIGVRVLAATALGALEKKESALESFAQLRTVKEPSIECSDFFASFKSAYLDTLDPRVEEARLIYQQEPSKGLAVLEGARRLPAEGMLLKGKILNQLGKTEEALDCLQEVRSIVDDQAILTEAESLVALIEIEKAEEIE